MSLEPHRWAVVSTIKAPTKDILSFAAHYLSLRATHLYLFLDFPDPEAQGHLENHPNIYVTNTAPNYKQARGRRPQTVEYLVPDDPDYTGPDQFKRLAAPFAPRRQISMWTYPEFGVKVSGGFLSRQVGKSFFRIVLELMASAAIFVTIPRIIIQK